MIIRKMNANDLPQLAILYRQFWNESSDVAKMGIQFEKINRQKTHILLCAIADHRLVGSVTGVVCDELYGDCRPFLVVENMVVDREARRMGVGTHLPGELERQARVRNCTQMILVTERDRSDACHFYEAYGFSRDIKGYKKKL
ncbi:GNAT family N-acetyltransferase [Sporolactobacillus shoreicorticis]|uniref:GNAT family N-acetyltransferase n=1 Tax=Sporolactobacillus shoreicorticis TaxID=1923877 RepID=A0ABW5S4N9_9BACL|nr:GNAT family N-acetyltransferase [Sporolactobacillus shoreicorticis]MCO7124465.1 GNAT family N-acetyltransferase [Sporolactobacillus shoreicorticis]